MKINNLKTYQIVDIFPGNPIKSYWKDIDVSISLRQTKKKEE